MAPSYRMTCAITWKLADRYEWRREFTRLFLFVGFTTVGLLAMGISGDWGMAGVWLKIMSVPAVLIAAVTLAAGPGNIARRLEGFEEAVEERQQQEARQREAKALRRAMAKAPVVAPTRRRM